MSDNETVDFKVYKAKKDQEDSPASGCAISFIVLAGFILLIFFLAAMLGVAAATAYEVFRWAVG